MKFSAKIYGSFQGQIRYRGANIQTWTTFDGEQKVFLFLIKFSALAYDGEAESYKDALRQVDDLIEENEELYHGRD